MKKVRNVMKSIAQRHLQKLKPNHKTILHFTNKKPDVQGHISHTFKWVLMGIWGAGSESGEAESERKE